MYTDNAISFRGIYHTTYGKLHSIQTYHVEFLCYVVTYVNDKERPYTTAILLPTN